MSVYSTLPAADISYVLKDSGAKILVTEAAVLDKALEAAAGADGVEVISVDEGTDEVRSLTELESERFPALISRPHGMQLNPITSRCWSTRRVPPERPSASN